MVAKTQAVQSARLPIQQDYARNQFDTIRCERRNEMKSQKDKSYVIDTSKMSIKANVINLGVNVQGIEEMQSKVGKLSEVLKEAKTLADELASMEIEVKTKD